MNRWTFAFCIVPLALAATGCSRESAAAGKHTDADLKTLSVDEVEARISAHDGKFFIFDNNSKDRYAQSHVPSARWVDFKNITADLLPPDKAATLVFYCANTA